MQKSFLSVGIYLMSSLAFGQIGQHSPFNKEETVTDEEIGSHLGSRSEMENLSSAAIASRISQSFLGRPYKRDVCGEGKSESFDRDPVACFKSVDCTTFVENVLALSMVREPREKERSGLVGMGTATCSERFWHYLKEIKYCDGNDVTFKNRNHFAEIHWCANAEKKGFLQDVTTQIYPEAIERRKWINTDAWIADKIKQIKDNPNLPEDLKQKQIAELQKESPNFANKEQLGRMKFIPLDQLLKAEVVKKLKAEKFLVFNMVKNEHSKLSAVPVLVSHQGFLLEKDGKLFLRMASSEKAKVVDIPFDEYVNERKKDENWPTLGFNFMRILDPENPR